MRPPETPLFWAGNIFRLIGHRMVQPMIRNPTRRMARAVEDRPENQELLDQRMRLQGFMRQHPVIANGCAEPAERGEEYGHAKYLEAREGK